MHRTSFGQLTFSLSLVLCLGSAFVLAEDHVPRVLILGDSVYQPIASEAAKELKGRVEVVHRRMDTSEVCNSRTMLEQLDELIGQDEWDVIHFNVGLGDLIYRLPGTKSFRVLPIHAGGVRATSPTEYRHNLEVLVARLKSTGAKLIWASTTPIRHSSTNVFQLKSEIEYNDIAAQVMREHNVTTNDMYAYVLDLIDMDRPASHGADPFFFDRKPLHPPLVDCILAALDLK